MMAVTNSGPYPDGRTFWDLECPRGHKRTVIQPAPMIRTPQVVAELQCNLCGVSLSKCLPYAEAMAKKAAMEPWECAEGCGCVAIEVRLSIRRAPDPIATVRTRHPRAFALPPGAISGRWTIIPSANRSPLPDPIAEGDTEAAAWAAAVDRVLHV